MTKLGAHTTGPPRQNFRGFLRSKPAVVTAVNDGGALLEAKAESGDHTITVFRDTSVYLDGPPRFDDLSITPEELAERWYPKLKAKWSQNPADYYNITNELGGNELTPIRRLVAYERAVIRMANADGFKVCVLNLAGGSPGDFDLWKNEIAPLVVEAWAAGNIYGRHAYGGDLVQSDGKVLAGNPRRPIDEIEWLNSQGHRGGMVITEIGLDGGFGFKGAQPYFEQMVAYEQAILRFDDIIGMCMWNLGPWHSSDANWQAAIPLFINHMEAHPTAKWRPGDEIDRIEMKPKLLRNADFDADWSEEQSHRCLIFRQDGTREDTVRGNIFSPPGWTTWFRHGLPEGGLGWDPDNHDGFSQPEVQDARHPNPPRMRSGQKGIKLFTFHRIHDAGFLQQVQVKPGTRLRFSAWAHAWSNHEDSANADQFPHPDDPRWSEGAGHEPFFKRLGTEDDDPLRNFTFWVGIDPQGGTNPFAGSVKWGQGAHIYNAYKRVPKVEAVAKSDTVTVFLRSRTLWRFKHNDAYWDDAELIDVGEPMPEETPREPYHRVCSVIPERATEGQALVIFLDAWRRGCETVCSNLDDAMMGSEMLSRTVNLYGIPTAQRKEYTEFRDTHYPGVKINFLRIPGE